MKKFLENLKNIIIFVIGVIYFTFALFMTILLLNYNKYNITQFGNDSWIMINEDISNEPYQKGDLVIAKKTKFEDMKEGEYLFTYRIDNRRVPIVQVGKIGTIYVEEKAISFENGETYSEDFIAGVEYKKYPKVGGYLSIIESKWGFLFIVLVPCLLIFIYELYALIVEIKYGADEEDFY